MDERPCDCAKRHQRFPERTSESITWELLHPPTRPRIPFLIPAMHQHEDERCSRGALGIGGCPGIPHCRDWIIGAYNAGITLAEVTGDKSRAFELSLQRDWFQRAFAGRKRLVAEVSP